MKKKYQGRFLSLNIFLFFFFQNTPKMLGKVPRIERTGTDNAPREIVEDKPFITELLVAELALTLLNFLFVIKKILGDI